MCFASLSFNSCLFRLFVKLLSETNAFLQRLRTHLILQVMTLHLHWYSNTHRLRKQGLLLLVAKLPLVSLVVVLLFNRGQKTFHGHPPHHLAHLAHLLPEANTLTKCEQNHVAWKNVCWLLLVLFSDLCVWLVCFCDYFTTCRTCWFWHVTVPWNCEAFRYVTMTSWQVEAMALGLLFNLDFD